MKGAFRLFQLWKVDVYLHWSWLLAAVFIINSRAKAYSSPVWNVAEYVAIFFFVLLHEFGHVLACRQTGGQANRIVLWPLGGLAYVNPPPRPLAQLWSIAAGPLVNVALLIVLKLMGMMFHYYDWNLTLPEAFSFLRTLWVINWILLLFNLLPVYPLDGGKIVQALLWLWLGQAKSLFIACLIGFAGAIALGAWALWAQLGWTVLIAVFLLSGNWAAFQRARALLRIEKLPHNDQFICPECHTSALHGNFWKCPACQSDFDVFENNGACPYCGGSCDQITCLTCGRPSSLRAWDKNQPPA